MFTVWLRSKVGRLSVGRLSDTPSSVRRRLVVCGVACRGVTVLGGEVDPHVERTAGFLAGVGVRRLGGARNSCGGVDASEHESGEAGREGSDTERVSRRTCVAARTTEARLAYSSVLFESSK